MFVTKEQVSQLSERLEQLERKPRRSSWDAGIDGRITRGDVLVGFLAILLLSFSGLAVGVGVGLLLSNLWRAIVAGTSGGLIIGGIVVGVRVTLDVLRIERTPNPPTPEVTPEPDYGLDVEVIRTTGKGTGQVLRTTMLPNVDRRLVRTMFRRAAIAVRQGNSFSKRGAGRFFGDSYSAVQSEMERLGLLTPLGKSPNAGYELTPEGKEWLEAFL